MKTFYVVKYEGHFGFIKPWTAVRDGGSPDTIHTFSQQFLTPSIIEGIEKKLFPELLQEKGISKIARHKLTYAGFSGQMEQTQTLGWEYKKAKKMLQRPRSILVRGVLLYPNLYLAFDSLDDAQRASVQHICLCRNEDVLFPTEDILHLTEEQFGELNGFELRFGQAPGSFLVGYSRFTNAPMYGWIESTQNPLKTNGF
ncbi:hypothetical protein VF13_40395 [Nostoc linckia z16]|nr:hypothetical protein VF13_40395 [Nostoc linckia z16]